MTVQHTITSVQRHRRNRRTTIQYTSKQAEPAVHSYICTNMRIIRGIKVQIRCNL